uniref:Metalloendopeptidase n=1 Tax=Kryptolebias marmoratus TaxID=37003 RepID=A0A3Q3G7S9_KRYMA
SLFCHHFPLIFSLPLFVCHTHLHLSAIVITHLCPLHLIILSVSNPVTFSTTLLPRSRSAIIDETKLWTPPVSYVLDKSLDLNAKGVILRAFDQFRVKSCINFKVWDSEEYYLNIQKLNGCRSYIGRKFANGQNLSIGAGCDSIAEFEHEILHALGFLHEQSRYDRDNHTQIFFKNIIAGKEHNFEKVSSKNTTTHETSYDYLSVMHYPKNAFTNGNEPTIITRDPKFQDVIGQRLDMSPGDVQELNLLYKCSKCLKMYCGFSNGNMCQMNQCTKNDNGWEVVTQADGGPSSDHTSLPSGNGNKGFFIHASTASGQKGDSARLETQTISPERKCNVQCLQFYYFHSGNESDELNIWIREELLTFGPPTSHWKLHHVSLNATKQFQVVFEVQKGAENSRGGFSIDDINLSETECPHIILQIDEFENYLNTSASGTKIYSPQQYSKEGYAYRVAVALNKIYVGMFVELLSGDFDNELEWPCLQKQMTFQLLDQNPNMQQQMTKQKIFTTTRNKRSSRGKLTRKYLNEYTPDQNLKTTDQKFKTIVFKSQKLCKNLDSMSFSVKSLHCQDLLMAKKLTDFERGRIGIMESRFLHSFWLLKIMVLNFINNMYLLCLSIGSIYFCVVSYKQVPWSGTILVRLELIFYSKIMRQPVVEFCVGTNILQV